MDGQVTGIQMAKLPSDENTTILDDEQSKYCIFTILYFGNGAETAPDGCCGSPLWTDEFAPLAQLQYYRDDTKEYTAPMYLPLREVGYDLTLS